MAGYGGRYIDVPGLVATGALGNYQYYIVRHGSTAGTVKVCASSTGTMIGILQNDPGDGEPALVACGGVCRALAEASVTAGSALTCSSTGRVKTTTTDMDRIIGQAVQASSSAGDLITVQLGISYMSHS